MTSTEDTIILEEFKSLRSDSMFIDNYDLFVDFRKNYHQRGKAAEIAEKLGKSAASLSALKSRLDKKRTKLSDQPDLKKAQIAKAAKVRDAIAKSIEGKSVDEPTDEEHIATNEIMEWVESHREILDDSLDMLAQLKNHLFDGKHDPTRIANSYANLMSKTQSYIRDRIEQFGTLTDGVTSDFIGEMQSKIEDTTKFLNDQDPALALKYMEFLEAKH